MDDPWGAFADDQLGLMDYLGVDQFAYIGYCIGGCFAGKLIERAPERVKAAVFVQSVGHRPEDPDVMYRHSSNGWAAGFMPDHPEVDQATIDQYLHNLYRVNPDFLYSVSRDVIAVPAASSADELMRLPVDMRVIAVCISALAEDAEADA